MKECKACSESFEGDFRFCPIDGNPLQESEPVGYQYCPTLIRDHFLLQRLITELKFLIDRFRHVWPTLKAHPLIFARTQLNQLGKRLRRTVAQPYVLSGSVTALAVVCCVVLAVLILERPPNQSAALAEPDALAPTIMIDLSDAKSNESGPGIGAGEKGRVGFERGRGEGSRPVPARAQGGGGGGNHAQLPASQGRLPQPSIIPAPIPTTFARLPAQALPRAGVDIDPVLWKNLPFPNYGDPRSKSVTPSNGPGDGGGVGPGKGTGIGEGEDNGFGPGKKGNIGGGEDSPGGRGKGGAPGDKPATDIERVFRQAEVTMRARVLFKPEPQYTEEARRNQITGTVILSVVFSRTGHVENIRAVQTLCCGLTEKAIASARQIQFVPAVRNGQTVSTYMQLEYNFNLY